MNIEDAKKKLDDANYNALKNAIDLQNREIYIVDKVQSTINWIEENSKLRTENDKLMLENIRLMDTNMRLITEIEAYNVYVLNNAKVGVK